MPVIISCCLARMTRIVSIQQSAMAFFLSVPLFLGMRNDIEIPCLFPPRLGLCVYSCLRACICERLGP